jgi:hypothetical protein
MSDIPNQRRIFGFRFWEDELGAEGHCYQTLHDGKYLYDVSIFGVNGRDTDDYEVVWRVYPCDNQEEAAAQAARGFRTEIARLQQVIAHYERVAATIEGGT